MRQNIVVTGIGAVTPLGIGVPSYWKGLITGGAESLINVLMYSGLCSTRAPSQQDREPQKASRPFDRLVGAGSATELIACIKAIQEGVGPPTINYKEPDLECDLDYVPNAARRVAVRVPLSNSFGFGSQNACLLMKKSA